MKAANSTVMAASLLMSVLVPGTAVAQSELQSPWLGNHSGGKRGIWSVMLFGGMHTENQLANILFMNDDRGSRFTETGILGGAVSKEVYRWNGFSVSLEGGLGYQFGEWRKQDNSAAHAWGAGYFRYDDFPWNHFVHTTIGGSVGVNLMSQRTPFENFETKNGDTKQLLHYFSPEISFALPDNLNDEVVIRLHHRSSAYGLFGCEVCGSNFVTVGLRRHF